MLTLMHSPMAAAVSSTTASSLLQTLPLVLIMVVLLAVMIIPQRKKEKKIKAMLDALKPGDRIRTIGGIYGTITKVTDELVYLQVGPDKVRLVFARGAVAQVEEQGVENDMKADLAE